MHILCICMYMSIYIYIFKCVRMCVYICVYIYIYIYIIYTTLRELIGILLTGHLERAKPCRYARYQQLDHVAVARIASLINALLFLFVIHIFVILCPF